ncbi:Hypothetical protein, predicted lipoprotein [Metamycoplasma auris 15026]|uniref:Uncharacterized protein n=1 Tax=Metamycoplasma auris 15026 TaxID=1188233 RepID=N9VAM8_9BACT|nr:hypothetical protein [Metamycoplasma auris]ENY68708.1 Hypothetical protein, predicted lipoprotein [Metamycoplasma auris 15026]
MKKSLKCALFMMPSLGLLGLPLVAASCNKTNSKIDNKDALKNIKEAKKDIEEIIKYEKDALEKENATKLLDQIKNLEKEDSKKLSDKELSDLLEKIKEAIADFNNRSFLGNEILKINRLVKNQGNTESEKVVEELKKTSDWTKLKEVFAKYSIEFKLLEEDKIKEIKVADESHSHPHEGIIHLTIEFGQDKTKFNYELVGFKLEPSKEDKHKHEHDHDHENGNNHEGEHGEGNNGTSTTTPTTPAPSSPTTTPTSGK